MDSVWNHTIRYYRKLRGYSQEKLAEMAEINEKLISFYETDSRTLPIFNLIEIASALDVTLDELCGLHHPEPISELEREVMRVIKDVLRGYTVQRVDDSTQRVDKQETSSAGKPAQRCNIPAWGDGVGYKSNPRENELIWKRDNPICTTIMKT